MPVKCVERTVGTDNFRTKLNAFFHDWINLTVVFFGFPRVRPIFDLLMFIGIIDPTELRYDLFGKVLFFEVGLTIMYLFDIFLIKNN